MISLRELITASPNLCPLQPTALRLAEVLASENSSVDECVKILRYDQAVTIDILKLANSASSASVRTITDLKDAVVRLGGARILALMTGKALKGEFSSAIPSYGYTEQDLWRHSIATATAAELLGTFVPAIAPGGLAFTAALLHDFGKLIIGRTVPHTEIERLWKHVREEQCTCEQAELMLFGFSHADAGAALLAEWKLPETLVNAVLLHHAPSQPESQSLTDCIKIANLVARSIGEGIGHEGMDIAIDNGIALRTKISRESFEKLCIATRSGFDRVIALFSS